MGSSKGGNSTTIVKNIPAYAESYVQSFLARAVVLSNDAYDAYGGTTYAVQNANEVDAIALMAARGRDGNLTITKATTYVRALLDGDYLLGTHPGFVAMLDKASSKPTQFFEDDIKSKVGGSLNLMQGDGEDIAETMLANTPSRYNNRAAAFIYDKAYRYERTTQGHALSYGIELAGQGAKDAELLRIAGLYMREYNQGDLEDAFKIWYEQQVANVRQLDILGNAIRALVGTQTATTEPVYRTSPVVAMAGGALAGAATASMLAGAGWGAAGGPVGMAVGAVIGGVIGLASS